MEICYNGQTDRQTDRITVPFCGFNMYNHALGCCGFAAVGGFFDF